MGKASKWFAKMATCIIGFKKAKKNAQTSSPCNEKKQNPGDQIPTSNHRHLAREVAAAIVTADSAAASIAEAAAAVARARESFCKSGGGEASMPNAAAVKIQKTLRGTDKIPAVDDHFAMPQRERLLKKLAQSATVTRAGDCICTTSHGGGEAAAATKIQKIYRGHLARRALRALKALVKVQALFRGRRVRKGIAAVWIQALIRARENMAVPPPENVCRRSPNFMTPTMSWKAKLRPAVDLKKNAEAGTGGKKQQYLLYVDEETGSRWQRTFARRNSFEA